MITNLFSITVRAGLAGMALAFSLMGVANLQAEARLGINLSGLVDWNTEHPLVDVFHLSRKWISQKEGEAWGKGPQLELDSQGWIQKLEPGCFAETPILTAGHAPVGEYICLCEGEGRIEFGGGARVVSRGPGRIVVNIDGDKGGVFVQVRETRPGNPVRNIRVIMPGFEKSWQADPFHPEFLRRWRGFASVRFMDWMDTNGSEQREWADRPKPGDASWAIKGAPVELMVDLCNRLKADPWFCMPHLATDDYVRRFAGEVKRSLDPSLKVYIEYSNEVWNSMFAQNRYAQAKALEGSLGPKERPWEGAAQFHARRSVEIFRIWEDVFGGRTRLVRVLAWQAAGGAYWTDTMLLGRPGIATNCDALAIAPYVSFMPGPKNSNLDSDEVAKWTVDQLLDRVETNALPECVGWMKTQKAVAQKYGLKFLCYEAGQHLVGVGGGENNEELTKLLIAANRHPRMGRIYGGYLDKWRETGGDLMCLFSSVGTSSKWGSWGLLEGVDEVDSSKFKAVMEWQRKSRN